MIILGAACVASALVELGRHFPGEDLPILMPVSQEGQACFPGPEPPFPLEDSTRQCGNLGHSPLSPGHWQAVTIGGYPHSWLEHGFAPLILGSENALFTIMTPDAEKFWTAKMTLCFSA